MGEKAERHSSADSFVLSVLAGPNAGASVSLEAGRYTIGSDDGNDIVLAGLGDQVINLTLKGEAIIANPVVDGVGLIGEGANGVSPLTVMGAPHQIKLPARLRLASDVTVQLSGGVQRPSTDRRVLVGVGMAALFVGCWLGAALFTQSPVPVLANLNGSAVANVPEQVAVAEPAEPAASPRISSSPQLECLGDCILAAETELKSRLAAAGLSNLTLNHENGVLRLGGTMLPEQVNDWRQIRTKFEAEFGQSLPIVTAIESETAPMLAVSSVWLGENAEVRTKTGNVYRVGDRTRDGWIVRKIERGSVEFERDGQSVAVRF
ncbi:hypothetical protein JJJ17_00200 [Paracoccus caeni]|uniref:Type III secretion protein D n=1 Tax=Paracoccus caeni TaxID=657651 RepID=A0A934VY29_9RHOB|nr:hypothetical protein [Paracoccus caeni]MBK4214335.1 hypothetical protein [Paracoccus caeni]